MNAIFPAVHALVHEGAIPPKAIAEESGIRYGYLMRAADPNEDDVQFQARWIAPVTNAAKNDILIKTIAEQCGGAFYRLAGPGKMDQATATSLKEFAEYLSAIADATSDRVVTPAEYYRAKAQAHDAISAILSGVEGLRVTANVPETER